MSNTPDVLARLDALSTSAIDAPPVPKIPAVVNKLSFRMPKVTVTISTTPKSPKTTKAPKGKSTVQPSPLPTVDQTVASASRHSGGRLASLRDKYTSRPSTSSSRTSTIPEGFIAEDSVKDQPLDEKYPVSPNSQPFPAIPSGPQVRDPVDVAVEKLVSMGFDEAKAKKALADTDTGNSINFESALAVLKKERKRKARLDRLDRMG